MSRNPLVSLVISVGLTLGNWIEARAGHAGNPPKDRLAYGPDPVQSIDFWPSHDAPEKARRAAPLVVFIHGGGWSLGTKENATGRAKVAHFTARGLAFATIGYRLVPGATVEDQATDLAHALAALLTNADRLGIDKNRVLLMGHSAGAHLASLIGTDARWLREVGLSFQAIAGIIAVEGAAYDVPQQLRDLRLHIAESELAKPFDNIPKNVPRPEVFAQRGKKELAERVAPAIEKLENFITTQYLPACRDSIGASSLPGGMAYYNFMVKNSTTTDLTTQQIHDIGLSEVARIRAEMQRVMDQVGFKGSFAEFTVFLNTDPRFYYTNSDDLLNGFRDIISRVYKVLPTMFAHLPAAQAEVKPIPLLGSEQQPAAYYNPGPDDGSRSGYFAANISNLNTRPKWGMETLTLHEAIPGHHLQITMAKEATGLPKFRRNGWYNAFGEGWALYSESLGDEMGFYKDPYSKFGNLNDELFRAARLVVDTGIHALGWSREQAIAYLSENTANPPSDNIVEIDRYIAWPGQALGYKIGQLKIRQLRAKAASALGDKFDIRTFHNAVIDNGAIPLSVLEAQIDTWIAQQQQLATPAASTSTPAKQ